MEKYTVGHEYQNKPKALSYIRACSKKAGLTFKKSNTRLNGGYLYLLTERTSGRVVMSNYMFTTAYNDACSGYIESWDGNKFAGVNLGYHRNQ